MNGGLFFGCDMREVTSESSTEEAAGAGEKRSSVGRYGGEAWGKRPPKEVSPGAPSFQRWG